MKAKGKLTATEWVLLLLAGVFLAGILVMHFFPRNRQQESGYTVTTQRQGQEAVLPEKINLNTATASQLETLDGIGPKLAQRIIDDREANGPFASVDDLDRVSGIGPATVENLRDFVTVEGET